MKTLEQAVQERLAELAAEQKRLADEHERFERDEWESKVIAANLFRDWLSGYMDLDISRMDIHITKYPLQEFPFLAAIQIGDGAIECQWRFRASAGALEFGGDNQLIPFWRVLKSQGNVKSFLRDEFIDAYIYANNE